MSTKTLIPERTLAESQVTGHVHQIETEGVEVYEGPAGRNGPRTIEARDTEFVVRHQEHKPIVIPGGVYETGIVREFDHVAEQARQVID